MAYTDREDLNYLGVLYLIGQMKTPFLNMIGGLMGTARGMMSRSFRFPLNQHYSLVAASQDTQAESVAAAAGTPVTTLRGQDYNVCQIMKKDAQVSFAKQSATGEFAGIQVLGEQEVTDELSFQKQAQLYQLALDINFSFHQGAFTDVNLANTNQKTRGMFEAIATNAIAAGGAALSKALIDQLLRTMAAAGCAFNNPVAFVNAYQKQQLSDIYGYAPMDRNVGGVNIKQIETDFCMLGIVYDPNVPTTSLGIYDLAYCRPVFLPYEGKVLAWYDEAQQGAKKGGFWYTQLGLDYGAEEFHGKLTGLAVA